MTSLLTALRNGRTARPGMTDVLLGAGVLVVLALLVLRVPPPLLDALLAVSLISGVALLLLAIYIPNPVAFNSFPSVLLISTLFRLALSVATTRLILIDAHAGQIVEAFGSFVAGGNLVVGIVVFVIITAVQFIVIAKGAERVAEVGARFTLDAMPGKQMSIDSDLRSGLIDKDEARRRRRHLEQESQLNGALDGAMKFVKGDAIASIIIVIVNLIGGLAIGVAQRGMSFGDAAHLYSILSIGDGMVAQLPALLSAMAAGLVVTRTSGDSGDRHLGATIVRQVLAQPPTTERPAAESPARRPAPAPSHR
jgi:type III secretion protein V